MKRFFPFFAQAGNNKKISKLKHYTVLRVQGTRQKDQTQGRSGCLKVSGGNDGEDTPVPIPNTEVKLSSADDTWVVTPWESRSLPDLYESLMVHAVRLSAFFCRF